MVTGIYLAAGAFAVMCFTLMTAVESATFKATLLIVGVGLSLVTIAFPVLKENHKRRRSDRLGGFVQRLLDLGRACETPEIDFAGTKKACDALGEEMDVYVKEQFGPGAVAHLNNSNGLSIEPSHYQLTADYMGRRPYSNWCGLRAARLSELAGDLHSE